MKPRTKPRQRKARAYDAQGWNQFWNNYPQKLDKARAYDAFCAAIAAGADAQVLCAGAAAYAAYCRIHSVEPRSIKYAQGWLNDDRWTDELDMPPTVGATDPAYTIGTPEYAARQLVEEDAAIAALGDA